VDTSSYGTGRNTRF